MPSPMGLKPGDVVKNKHGTHIRISNPDNDCRVVLADVVNFTEYYSPCLVIDVGTFTSKCCICFLIPSGRKVFFVKFGPF